jgi:hypothetical protein
MKYSTCKLTIEPSLSAEHVVRPRKNAKAPARLHRSRTGAGDKVFAPHRGRAPGGLPRRATQEIDGALRFGQDHNLCNARGVDQIEESMAKRVPTRKTAKTAVSPLLRRRRRWHTEFRSDAAGERRRAGYHPHLLWVRPAASERQEDRQPPLVERKARAFAD